MKRLHVPVSATPSPLSAAITPAPVEAPTKAVVPTRPAPRWPHRDIGVAILSFPSDLRPRSG